MGTPRNSISKISRQPNLKMQEKTTPPSIPPTYTTNPLVCLKSLTLISRQTNTAPIEMT